MVFDSVPSGSAPIDAIPLVAAIEVLGGCLI